MNQPLPSRSSTDIRKPLELPVGPDGCCYFRDWYGVWWVRRVDNPVPAVLHQRVASLMARVMEIESVAESLDAVSRAFKEPGS